MAVLINRTQKNFTMISNSILRDKDLSLKDRGLLCTICSLPDKWEFSIAGLSAIIPDGKDAIASAIKRLEKLGYLVRTMSRNHLGKFVSEIEVFTERRSAADSPERESRHGIADTGSPVSVPVVAGAGAAVIIVVAAVSIIRKKKERAYA